MKNGGEVKEGEREPSSATHAGILTTFTEQRKMVMVAKL